MHNVCGYEGLRGEYTMPGINAELAQEIVERTMNIIPFSVNVMDTRGIIVASGTPERIGDLHAGAQLALAQGRAIEVGEAAMPNLHGAKPGINLPLIVRGEIAGVVGLSGEPASVRQFGELVRVTAEMILEQAQLTAELQREHRYREEFVFQLVKRGSLSAEGLEAWAARLGVDLTQARAVFVLELGNPNGPPELAMAGLEQAQRDLAVRWPHLLSAVISPRELVLLEVFDAAGSAESVAAAGRRRLAELDAVCGRSLGPSSLLSMGIALPGIAGAAASYDAARKTAQIGRARDPAQRLHSYYELSFAVLLASLDWGWQGEHLRRPLMPLAAVDRPEGTLVKTLIAWFAHGSQAVATAKALRIHRNTLDYRLQKISEITGLDLANTDHRLQLYVALQLGVGAGESNRDAAHA